MNDLGRTILTTIRFERSGRLKRYKQACAAGLLTALILGCPAEQGSNREDTEQRRLPVFSSCGSATQVYYEPARKQVKQAFRDAMEG